MSFDPHTEPTTRMTGNTDPSGSNQPVGVMTQHGRPGVYIYPFWQRTEFWVMALTSLAILIATAIEDGFPAQAGWTLITVLGAAYIVSRGLAKREPRDDSGDRPWAPGS
jgi:hypothetical protein